MPRQKKILVIEDAHSLRRDIVEMLQYEGYQVSDAENGVIGVARALEVVPDLIICDVMMPLMGGFAVLETLRKDRRTATVPFIFLTARVSRDDQRAGMQSGADDYVTKPFTAMELIETVRVRLENYDRIREESEARFEDLRGNIITAMPHELRTPLNVILGFSSLLISDAEIFDAPHVREMAEYINAAGNRLFRLVENYVTYSYTEIVLSDSSAESKRRDVFKSGIMVNAASTLQAVALEHAAFSSRGGDLVFDVTDVGALAIHEEYFHKIVEELIDNACKFSSYPSRPVQPPIEVRSHTENGTYKIAITDHGRGMKPEQVNQIGAYMQFERHLYEQQGSGLGLIIAKRLTELHGGSLDVESTFNVGTTVTVSLPLVVNPKVAHNPHSAVT